MNRSLNKVLQVLGTSSSVRKPQSRPPTRRQGGGSRGFRPARTVNNPSWGRSLPAAYASHVRPRMNISRRGDSVIVDGCDLVYPIPVTVAQGGLSLFSVIPCNPAYWSGTRIGQFAPAYMNYRPLSIVFSYIPQVAVTQQGTVYMGTLWNGAPSGDDLQQTLFTSNGGCLTQCYVPADTRIKLGSNLQQNLFTLSGPVDPNTSPFVFMAGVAGADVVPGYFYVTYKYEFKNPIGAAWNYGRINGLMTQAISQYDYQNRSAILLQGAGGYGPGTVLDIEDDNTVKYNGSIVQLPDDATMLLLWNEQAGSSVARSEGQLAAASTIVSMNGHLLSEFTLLQESTVPARSLYIYVPRGAAPNSYKVNLSGSESKSPDASRVWVFTGDNSTAVDITFADGKTMSISDNDPLYPAATLTGFTLDLPN